MKLSTEFLDRPPDLLAFRPNTGIVANFEAAAAAVKSLVRATYVSSRSTGFVPCHT